MGPPLGLSPSYYPRGDPITRKPPAPCQVLSGTLPLFLPQRGPHPYKPPAPCQVLSGTLPLLLPQRGPHSLENLLHLARCFPELSPSYYPRGDPINAIIHKPPAP